MMVSHVVLMKPKPDLAASAREALVDAFERAVREIPTVRDVRIGRRVLHGAGYEASAPDAADFLAMIDFDDLAGLQTYLQHPVHAQLGARFSGSLSAAVVYDFEVGGMDALRAGGLAKAEQLPHACHHTGLVLAGDVDLREDVEALIHRSHDTDAEALRGDR
jgi:Stress responsive A/B Barrel Domain